MKWYPKAVLGDPAVGKKAGTLKLGTWNFQSRNFERFVIIQKDFLSWPSLHNSFGPSQYTVPHADAQSCCETFLKGKCLHVSHLIPSAASAVGKSHQASSRPAGMAAQCPGLKQIWLPPLELLLPSAPVLSVQTNCSSNPGHMFDFAGWHVR